MGPEVWTNLFSGIGLAEGFDSINPNAMVSAFRRFGIPDRMVEAINNLYADRRFRVVDGTSQSKERTQQSGISQGCPLSPFLFVAVMSILLEEAVQELPIQDQEMYERVCGPSLPPASITIGTSSPVGYLLNFDTAANLAM